VPDGRAVMVVGKFLGADSLQRWLGDQGYPTTRLASAKGFRVLESRRAP
jgi:16S rRNA (guanine1207-N2)-methyltransferase